MQIRQKNYLTCLPYDIFVADESQVSDILYEGGGNSTTNLRQLMFPRDTSYQSSYAF